LTWSHFKRVLSVTNEKAQMYYLQEAAAQTWSIRTLDRNISTLYFNKILHLVIKSWRNFCSALKNWLVVV